MTLPASGPISFNAINLELGLSGTATKSINDSDYRNLSSISSGIIDIQDFYGKTNIVYGLIDGSVSSIDLDSAFASYTINGDGIVTTLDETSVLHNTEWVSPTSQSANHQVRATLISGSIDGTFGTWLFNGTWNVSVSGIGNSTTGSFTIQVRDTATNTIRDTATISLTATVAS